jgi:CubicO group peptidase (beta-lactamase class C family)
LQTISSKKSIDEHTLFPLASLTKPFTAMAIGILQEQGRLNLDDPIADIWCKFASNPTLTIRHLIEHRSGLIRDLTDQRVISPMNSRTRRLGRCHCKGTDEKQSRQHLSVQQCKLSVLARLVEAVADQSYESY